MREILFRGRCNEAGKYKDHWIEGHYGEDEGRNEIFFSTKIGIVGYSCEPESIGQYTGLTDKSGKKIFEDDIIRVKYSIRCPIEVGNSFRIGTYDTDYIASVIFDDCRFCLAKANGEIREIPLSSENIEVIGNIHDNPEMLEVTK